MLSPCSRVWQCQRPRGVPAARQGPRVPRALFLHLSCVCQSCCAGKGPIPAGRSTHLGSSPTELQAPCFPLPQNSCGRRLQVRSWTKGAVPSGLQARQPCLNPQGSSLFQGHGSVLPSQEIIQRIWVSASAEASLEELKAPLQEMSSRTSCHHPCLSRSSSVLGTSWGTAVLGPAHPGSPPFLVHQGWKLALGSQCCPGLPRVPGQTSTSTLGGCLHQETFIPFT